MPHVRRQATIWAVGLRSVRGCPTPQPCGLVLKAKHSFNLLRPSLPRQKTQIIRAHRRRLAPAGRPLQHLRRQFGQPQLAADMAFHQPHGLCQFLYRGELTGIHAPPPAPCPTNGTRTVVSQSSTCPDGPGPKARGPRASNLEPRTKNQEPRTKNHGPRISIHFCYSIAHHHRGVCDVRER